MGKLHSERDDELEAKDQSIFGRVVLLAGIALVVLFLTTMLLMRRAGRHIDAIHPDKHPTSQVAGRADAWLA